MIGPERTRRPESASASNSWRLRTGWITPTVGAGPSGAGPSGSLGPPGWTSGAGTRASSTVCGRLAGRFASHMAPGVVSSGRGAALMGGPSTDPRVGHRCRRSTTGQAGAASALVTIHFLCHPRWPPEPSATFAARAATDGVVVVSLPLTTAIDAQKRRWGSVRRPLSTVVDLVVES